MTYYIVTLFINIILIMIILYFNKIINLLIKLL